MEERKTCVVTGAETALGVSVADYLDGHGYATIRGEGASLPEGAEAADLLVCCHGTSETLDWLSCTADEWRAMRAQNLDSMFTCLQTYANARVAAGAEGIAILVTHDDSNSGSAEDVLWSTTSWGVRGLVRNAAAAYARKGVRVNGVCAGAEGVSGEDIAALVAFLAQGAHITGQTIPVAGGRTLL